MDALPVLRAERNTLVAASPGPNANRPWRMSPPKTGWLRSAYTLSGVVRAADGTVLSFAFYCRERRYSRIGHGRMRRTPSRRGV